MRPRFGFVKAQQQLEQGALAGAARSDQGDGFAGTDVEREVVEGDLLGSARVAEPHPFEADRAACGKGRRPGIGKVAHRRFGGQQLGDAFHRAGRALHLAPDFGECADRTGRRHRVEHELAERAGGHGRRPARPWRRSTTPA
jgi:hypothetical protein